MATGGTGDPVGALIQKGFSGWYYLAGSAGTAGALFQEVFGGVGLFDMEYSEYHFTGGIFWWFDAGGILGAPTVSQTTSSQTDIFPKDICPTTNSKTIFSQATIFQLRQIFNKTFSQLTFSQPIFSQITFSQPTFSQQAFQYTFFFK